MRIDSSRYRYLDQQQKPKHLSGQTTQPLSSPIPADEPPCSLPSKEQPYVTMDEKRGFFSGTRSSRRARPLIIIILLGILGYNLW
ncbi:hypothetical protein BN1723_005406, partial [Verticillium longisporum]